MPESWNTTSLSDHDRDGAAAQSPLERRTHPAMNHTTHTPPPGAPFRRCAARGLSTPWLAPLLTGLGLATSLAAQAVPPQTPLPVPTRTAANSIAVVSGGGFEATTIATSQYAPNWSPWTMSLLAIGGGNTSGSGIAKNGSPLVAQSAPTTAGQYVMFVRGLATSRITVAFQPGTWRVRFRAAQRVVGVTPDNQSLQVTVRNIPVFQDTPTAKFVDYVSDAFTLTTAASHEIAFRGQTGGNDNNFVLIDQVMIAREQPWSSTATWGGAVPTAADHVSIPELACVSMDGTCLAASVQLYGMAFANPAGATLTSKWVMVSGSGSRFQVGTPSVPFLNGFTLSLVGDTSSVNIMGGGTKFLMAMNGGRIEMHGRPTNGAGLPKLSWTKLAAMTKVSGSTTDWAVTLAEPTGWENGDSVAIARSTWVKGYEPWTPGTEVGVITQVTSSTAFVVTMPVGSQPTYHSSMAPTTVVNPGQTESWVVDERAEVGLLTHNVRIEGVVDANSVAFGGHVMIMNCPMCVTPGFARFSFVELANMGQKSLQLPIDYALGRYPLHWHMQIGNGAGQYVRSSSIHNSFNRAVTIHGSHGVEVADNVMYDQEGHAVFFEDGVEQNNRILRNLVMVTRPPASGAQLLSHDNAFDQPQNRSPASFWISHPNNEFVGNVAVDSPGTGYWFALHRAPTGKSASPEWSGFFTGIDATHAPLGAFRDNVSHSCKSGLDVNDSIDDSGTPTNPLDDVLATNVAWVPGSATIDRFVSYGNGTGVYAGTGNDQVLFDRNVLVDNEWSVQFACAFTVQRSLLVENSKRLNATSRIFQPSHPSFAGHAHVVYDGPSRIVDSHLIGFDGTTSPDATAVSSVFGANQRHTNHGMAGITRAVGDPGLKVLFDDFAGMTEPATPLVGESYMTDSRHWGIVVLNLDASLGGPSTHPSLVSNHPMLHLTNGASTPDVQFPVGANAWLSPFRWGYVRIYNYRFPNFTGQFTHDEQPDMTWTREAFSTWPAASWTSKYKVDAFRQLPMLVRPAGSAQAECQYTVDWAPTDASGTLQGKAIRVVVDDLAVGDVTRIKLRNQFGWSGEQVSADGVPLVALTDPAQLGSQTSTAYARVPGTFRDLWLRVVNTGKTSTVNISW